MKLRSQLAPYAVSHLRISIRFEVCLSASPLKSSRVKGARVTHSFIYSRSLLPTVAFFYIGMMSKIVSPPGTVLDHTQGTCQQRGFSWLCPEAPPNILSNMLFLRRRYSRVETVSPYVAQAASNSIYTSGQSETHHPPAYTSCVLEL
jgi:hypothetical protein